MIIGFTILLIYIHFKKSNEITFNEDYEIYQYFTGIRVDYKGNATISRSGDIIKVTTKEDVDNITDVPMYINTSDNELLTTQNMQLVFPRYKNKNYKLKFFTKIRNKRNLVRYYVCVLKQFHLFFSLQ